MTGFGSNVTALWRLAPGPMAMFVFQTIGDLARHIFSAEKRYY
jgi:hypothetical protein